MIKFSATLHKQENLKDVIYYYPLRKAIENEHLVDY